MSVDLELYRNREQSFIKHLFLRKYLEAAAFKTLQGHSPIFNFVDAFAGPWNASDTDKYSDASFGQAIDILESVRVTLGKMGKGGMRIRFCLCEKRPSAAQELRRYASANSKFEIHVFEGKFEEKLDEISKAIPDGFTFTFIDPTGWKIQSSKIFDFLCARKGEFLLNFMSDHINRHAEYAKVVQSFGHFLADPNWADEFAKTDSTLPNEMRVLQILKRKMIENKVARFLPDISILLPREDRLKMRLILGTHSPHGLELFRDVQALVERDQIAMRNGLASEESGQNLLFSASQFAAFNQQQDGVGSKRYKQEARAMVLHALKSARSASCEELELILMDQLPLRSRHVREVLLEMRLRSEVDFVLPPRKRTLQRETLVHLPPALS